jgi:truncated hemoglobin YjbI
LILLGLGHRHLPLPIGTPHFDRWLSIFAETAEALCPPAAAAHFVERAYRIADSLEFGIAFHKGEAGLKRPHRERNPSSSL